MKKETFWTKMIKRFYGVSGELDEYREQTVNRIGNHVFLGFWWYLILTSLLAITLYFKYPQLVGLTYLISTAFVTVIVIPFIILLKLNVTDVMTGYTEVPKDRVIPERKKALKRTIIIGVIWTLSIHLFSAFTHSGNHDFWYYFFKPSSLLASLLGGAVFTVFMALLTYYSINEE